MGTEASTRPPPDAGGLPIRLFSVTRPDGTVVYVQAISIVDSTFANNQVDVSMSGGVLAVDTETGHEMLRLLRRMVFGLEMLLERNIPDVFDD